LGLPRSNGTLYVPRGNVRGLHSTRTKQEERLGMNIKLIIEAILAAFKTSAPPKSDSKTSGRMRIKNVEMIKVSEGLRLEAYLPTPNDVWTIGYGHTKTAKPGMKITNKGAEALLLHDLEWVEDVIELHVEVALTQNQYDALCSFIYNLGGTNFASSTLLRKLNKGDYQGAADQLPRWNKQKGKVLRGLTIRRKEERDLFLS